MAKRISVVEGSSDTIRTRRTLRSDPRSCPCPTRPWPSSPCSALAGLAAGYVDAVVGGGGLIQLPALLLGLPGAGPVEVLGTNKLVVDLRHHGERCDVLPARPA